VAIFTGCGFGGVVVNHDTAEGYCSLARSHPTPLRSLPDFHEWLKYKAQLVGDSEAQANLGLCYQYGNCGAEKNEVEALRLYRVSADQGNGNGQARLGLCYQYGYCGAEKNEVEALRLYRLSADQGNSDGQAFLGFCYQCGRCGVEKDEAVAQRLKSRMGHLD
jgi:TPR repeat protein